MKKYAYLFKKVCNMLNFKELRKKKNFTQSEFAEKINVSTRALSNYENGNTDITLKKIQEIAEVLEVPIIELFKNDINISNNKNIDYTKEIETNKDEIIKLLKERIVLLEQKLEPFNLVMNKIEENYGNFDKFIEASSLLIQVDKKIDEIENKKSNNNKKRGSA
jgi:transcriptional regulator with XRE-family HTH domain